VNGVDGSILIISSVPAVSRLGDLSGYGSFLWSGDILLLFLGVS